MPFMQKKAERKEQRIVKHTTFASQCKERCQSDRMDRTRNPANGLCCSVGLNPTLSAEGTLNKSLENTKKIRKYRNFKELRYFSFMPIQLLRVRIEVANTPKILSNGYNLATLFRAD